MEKDKSGKFSEIGRAQSLSGGMAGDEMWAGAELGRVLRLGPGVWDFGMQMGSQ